MAKRSTTPIAPPAENFHQVAGIRTGTLNHPPGLGGLASRVAFVDTGSGLRFTIALDRGGDIVDARFNQHNLAYLTGNDYEPNNPAFQNGSDWLVGWPGGLMTTCGPEYIGNARTERGVEIGAHGRHSSTTAAVETILNPDPRRRAAPDTMSVAMIIRDTRLAGPTLEVRRLIRCRVGVPEIVIEDTVTNRGDTKSPHNWLYHVNAGYPMLDEGARHFYGGKQTGLWNIENHGKPLTRAAVERLKRVTPPLPGDAGMGGRCITLDSVADASGLCHIGLINARLGLGLEVEYAIATLPRFANWQHYGPAGSYVSGIEPFAGSLAGLETDNHRLAEQYLEPGETRRYAVTLRIHTGAAALRRLARFDRAITS